MPENFLPLISIAWSLVSGLSAVIVVVWNIRGMVAEFDKKIDGLNANIKADFENRLLMFTKDYQSKIDRNYERLDVYKKLNEDRIEQLKRELELKYVQIEMCNVMHNSNVAQMIELKSEINRKVDELKSNIGKIFDILNSPGYHNGKHGV